MSVTEPRTYSKSTEKVRGRRRKSEVKEEIKGLIIDNGAYTIKIGNSTAEGPDIIPNCIMKAKSERKRLFIGSQIDECRDCSGLYFLLPCERGYITRWEVQKPIWDHIFSRSTFQIQDNPVIVTQPLFNFKSIQDCMDEIFFEEYEVPSLFRPNPTDLASLKYTEEKKLPKNDACCVIVDSGYSFTHVIPYIRGKKYLEGIRRLNVGGKLLTNHLKDIISYRQYNVMEETYVINQVKEDTCYIAKDVKEELKIAAKGGSANSIVRNYVLPDFNNVRRGYILDSMKDQQEIEENCQILRLNNERFVVPEILFHPSDIGMKSIGIAEAIVKSIMSCPKDKRENLSKNIVLIGGNCKFPGYKERMFDEVRTLLPDTWEVNIFQPDDPISYSWSGGRNLLRLPQFKTCLVTKQEYDELGSTIIQQRFNNFMVDNSTIGTKEDSKVEQEFKYLDKLKSDVIFGKHEPDKLSLESKSNSETSSNADQSENTEEVRSVTTEKEESTVGSEETSQDSYPSTEIELAKNISKKLIPNKKSKLEFEEVSERSEEEEDLLNSVELFPFGYGSYL